MSRVIVAGGRDFKDYKLLEKTLNKHLPKRNVTIVQGEAKGADALGKRYAVENSIGVDSFPADWDRYGKAAGHRRNAEMAAYAKNKPRGMLIAFWDGKSRGTSNMINTAIRYKLKILIIFY